MNPWLETLGVILLAVVGGFLGLWLSRLPRPYWLLGYFLPLAALVLIALARWIPRLEFVAPMSWLMAGRTEFALCPLVGTMIFTTLMSRIPRRQLKILISILMVLVCAQPLWMFIAPAFNRASLARLVTRTDNNGICLQSTEYNCGPAAAVTALRKLGLPAEEGDIAILFHCAPGLGTQPDVMCEALKKRYGSQGLNCEYRYFDSISELKNDGITIAVTKFSFWVDHYVTVLEVDGDTVIVGDPLSGKQKLSREDFTQKWRLVGVVLKRDATTPATPRGSSHRSP